MAGGQRDTSATSSSPQTQLRPSISQSSLQSRYSLSGHAPIRFPPSTTNGGNTDTQGRMSGPDSSTVSTAANPQTRSKTKSLGSRTVEATSSRLPVSSARNRVHSSGSTLSKSAHQPNTSPSPSSSTAATAPPRTSQSKRAVSTPLQTDPRPNSKVLTSFPFPHPTVSPSSHGQTAPGDAGAPSGGTLRAGLRWLGLDTSRPEETQPPVPAAAPALETTPPRPSPRRQDSSASLLSSTSAEPTTSTAWQKRLRRLAALPVRLLTRTDEEEEDRQERDEEEASEILEREALLYAQRRATDTNEEATITSAPSGAGTAKSYGTLPLSAAAGNSAAPTTRHARTASIDSLPDPCAPSDPFGYRALAAQLDLLPSHADYLAERRRARRARRLRRTCQRVVGLCVGVVLLVGMGVGGAKGYRRWKGEVSQLLERREIGCDGPLMRIDR